MAAELESWANPPFVRISSCTWIYENASRTSPPCPTCPPPCARVWRSNSNFARSKGPRETGLEGDHPQIPFQLEDGQMIETVLIPASPALYGERADRRTICISSQVGCAYGCRFCASGIDGWKRNLTAGEIAFQFLAVEEMSGEKINNIVFMGMGEPFANYDNLMRAIGILNAPGASASARAT